MAIFGRWLGDVPAAQVYLTGDKSLGGTGAYPISWDAALVNVGDIWDSGDDTKLTVPVSGIYAVAAIVNDPTSSAPSAGIGIGLNGTHASYMTGTPTVFTVSRISTASTMMYLPTQLISLEAGDYIEIVYTNTVDPTNLESTTTTASIHYIGRS